MLRLSVDLAIPPAEAFDRCMEGLSTWLDRQRIDLRPGPDGGVRQRDVEVARTVEWEAGRRALLEWRPRSWEPERVTRIEIRADALEGGSVMTLMLDAPEQAVGEGPELLDWFVSELAGGFLEALAPAAVGDWLTDRQARRPWGDGSREVYRDPVFHHPNFSVILNELALARDDHLLEVGCGGGALLKRALASGCRAAGVDHSPAMLEVARSQNEGAVREGRLELREAAADELPFPDATFTCAVMTGVLGFLADPVAALREMHRVLRPGGRIVILGSDPELRGTPAAPEPMASRLRFYDGDELEGLAKAAGFQEARAVWRRMYEYAVEAGVPEAALPLFDGPGGRFLLARKAAP